MDLRLHQKVELKKQHPCGSRIWTIRRVGMDIKLRCEGCGRIVHLDCTHLRHLYDHLEAEHHFRIDPRRTILTGLCQTCGGKEASHGSI